MDAKEYLHEIWEVGEAIEHKMRALERLDDMLKLSSIQYSPDKVQSSMKPDTLEKKAIKHLEKRTALVDQMEDDLTHYVERQQEAVNLICKIDSEEQKRVLMLRYIEHKKWATILELRGCDSLESQRRLHQRAVRSLQKVLDGSSMAL